jgi:putative DNA primase/helicase
MTAGDYDRVRHEEAAKLGWRVETLNTAVAKARHAAPNPDQPAVDRPPVHSDEAVALRFSERHAEQLRYVAPWGRWLIWESGIWRFDDTLRAFSMAREVCREAAAECGDPRIATALASSKTVAAVEKLAKADPRHAATHRQWDADAWLLNTPDGVVDLRTGKVGPHTVDDYMTKMTAVAPGGDCPLWLSFLDKITAGDCELQDFLQRMAGYCLTGSIREHALFFGFGTGANGKSTFANTISGMLGDYAVIAPMETFTARNTDRHPTDLAMMRGARLVIAQETEEGRRWDESKIKAITGGDPITARFMRQDFFTFPPAFKLLLMGNHKPALRSVDEAVRRRFNLIPFIVCIPQHERDEELFEKLKLERPGILRWAINGCLKWQETRLAAPTAVVDATDAYLQAEDALGQWIDECCAVRPPLWNRTAELYASWRVYAEYAGEGVGSQKQFSEALATRGFTRKREPGTGRSGFSGIAAVRAPDTAS